MSDGPAQPPKSLAERVRDLFSPDQVQRSTVNLGVYGLVGLMLFVTVVLVPFSGIFDVPELVSQGDTAKGRIVTMIEDREEASPLGRERIQVMEVEFNGRVEVIQHREIIGGPYRFNLQEGDRVLVTAAEGIDGERLFIADRVRESSIWLFAIIFAALVLLIGRFQGFTSLVGMVASLLVILQFIIPGIASGNDPVTMSLIGAPVILATSLFLSHGVNRKTITALLGTTVSLVITTTLASLAIDLAHLSGLESEESRTLHILTQGAINTQGLLLAAIIIGSLGVLDDVSVAQASSVFELRKANTALTTTQLFSRAMNIGRDHIASVVNTLFLAYTGAAMPLLVTLSLQTEPLGMLINREFLSTEILRTLVGSIGIVAAVPMTTAMAALACSVAVRRIIGEDEDTGSRLPHSHG